MSDSSQHRVHFFLIPFVCLLPPYTLKGLARFCLTCVNDALFVSHLQGQPLECWWQPWVIK